MSIPRLNFSDITSGPKTGLGDGLGSGVIVTVWGNNLGSSQGSSTISIGGVNAAYVYYWGNATGALGGGPANLYTYHKMQEISFSIPAGVADGAVTISVTVGGVTSNTLPFTVRAGNIYFVKTTGSDSTGTGTWSNPRRTLNWYAYDRLEAGDTVYACDGIAENSGLATRYLVGTLANPISFIAYPGAAVSVNQNAAWSLGNYAGSSHFCNFSKIRVTTTGTGIDTHEGMRAVGNEITNYSGLYASGSNGAISGSDDNNHTNDTVSNIKCFGNYIHDFGGDNTQSLHHVFYISNRSSYTREAFELGWNHLADNKAHHGLHVYDEGICGNLTGTLRIHDNVVVNQVGVAVGVACMAYDGYNGFSMPVEIYNNLFIRPGKEIPTCSGHNVAISLSGLTNTCHVKIYNNTLYGYGQSGGGWALDVQGSGDDHRFGGTWEYVNNIVVDTNDRPYEYPTYGDTADVHTNNLWYNGGDSTPASPPSWDTSPVSTDPLFTNAGAGDFSLQSSSPAKGTGANLSATVTHDLLGNPRTLPFDMGAIAYVTAGAPPTYSEVPYPYYSMLMRGGA